MNATQTDKCDTCGKYVHCPETCPECGQKAVLMRHATGKTYGCRTHGIFPLCLGHEYELIDTNQESH